MESVIIGVDPDVEKCGVAAIKSGGGLPPLLGESTILELFELANTFEARFGPTVFVVEASWLSWSCGGRVGGLSIMEDIRRAGENHGAGKTIVQILKGMGFKVVLVSPRAKKLCPAAVMAELGLDVKPSQEACDAYAVAKAYKLLKP
jgi:hypothetical protein